jgi:hypothetical protein
MDIGDIVYFTTTKARGHDTRSKYHVYLFVGDWRDEGEYGFLFINKSNAYGDGFEIKKTEGYGFLDLEMSYISCSAPVCYKPEELAKLKPEFEGCLREEDVEPLIAHVQASHVLEEHHIQKICAALRRLL